jgi:hypothetical protein
LTDPNARTPVVPVKPDSVITAINRYRAASAELDKIAVREPTLPNGNPADETEEYAVWETASHKAQDVAATAWAEVTATQPTTVAGAIGRLGRACDHLATSRTLRRKGIPRRFDGPECFDSHFVVVASE